MTVALSVNKPGLVSHAAAAKREIVRLQALLVNTTGSHATVTTDAATCITDLNALIAAIAAL